MEAADERLGRFLDWAQQNGIQFRGCTIKQSQDAGGFGVFSGDSGAQGVLVVTPLSLSLTAMTVLKDPTLGTQYREMLDGDIDERLLVMIFLIIERARGKESCWAPYLDMLPCDYGTPLWFDDEELKELQGTTLFEATKAQLRSLRRLFDKVKACSEAAMLSAGFQSEVEFKDFLWANCTFWTRALNIPCPTSFISPGLEVQPEGIEICSAKDRETIWIEGLVPGIDFCNHVRRASALWEVDGKEGATSGVPHTMYLIAGPEVVFPPDSEILINYGDKGNEELLFLYGFVEEDNPNDYVMVHFPKELLEQDNIADSKLQLLQEQDLPLQWLLPSSLLSSGFLHASDKNPGENTKRKTGYSWSGVRKAPSYLDSLIFPEEMVSSLRVLAMSEVALQSVIGLLEQLSHVPSKDDIQAAIWEVCGDSEAFGLLVQILSNKMAALVQHTGTEAQDERLLKQDTKSREEGNADALTRNHRACILYRKAQKHLVSNFLKEAELALAASQAEEEQILIDQQRH